ATHFNANPTPRKQRTLRLAAPRSADFAAPDGVGIRLTRYRGEGSKGPVLLLHGLGVSSRIFTTDTIDTNLTEFLVAQGYDAWLLDTRVSTELDHATAAAT